MIKFMLALYIVVGLLFSVSASAFGDDFETVPMVYYNVPFVSDLSDMVESSRVGFSIKYKPTSPIWRDYGITYIEPVDVSYTGKESFELRLNGVEILSSNFKLSQSEDVTDNEQSDQRVNKIVYGALLVGFIYIGARAYEKREPAIDFYPYE